MEPRLTTYADPTGHTLVDPTLEIARAEAYLEGVANRLRSTNRVVRAREDFGPVADAILNAARENEADLIALATHGRGGLTRLVLGSQATALVRRAETPLLVVRPHATRRPAAE